MHGKLTGWDDTIVALATPPGIGALGVIRVSGPRSWEMVNGLFPSKDLGQQASHTLHVGFLKEGGETLDEVVVSLFRGPRSYTGEDVVELSCHGSPYVQERVIQAILRGGARLARAGEFTQRAFLHGKLDLTQAEAVADLIASNSKASARTALHNIRGGFSRALRELREQLLSFSALIELELDFSQEDVEFADRGKFYALIAGAEALTADLLQSFRLGNVIRHGVQVAIIGKPNAGKSTLLNTLLNENRAIVSEIAGTTRDTIEETLNIEGLIFKLIDTAGLRAGKMAGADATGKPGAIEAGVRPGAGEAMVKSGAGQPEVGSPIGMPGAGAATVVPASQDAGKPGAKSKAGSSGEAVDTIEAIGIQRSLEKMEAADIVVYLFDINDPVEEIDARREELVAGGKPFLIVLNKIDTMDEAAARLAHGDMLGATGANDGFAKAGNVQPGDILISAREGRHINLLKQALVDQVLQGKTSTEGTIITNARHQHALQLVADSLADIHRGLDSKLPGDLLALDIRRCLHYLGEITGEITTEDQLGYIFGKFCVGK